MTSKSTKRGPDSFACHHPSQIQVSGIAGTITKLTINLNGLSHAVPDDLDIVLEAPSLVVTTTVGVVDQFDGQTSLREAIALANSAPDLDTIVISSSLAGETLLVASVDVASVGAPFGVSGFAVSTPMVIQGPVSDRGAALLVTRRRRFGRFMCWRAAL